MSKPVRKVLSIISYIVMVFFIFILAKTELRKWLVMEGQATPANTVIWWVSLGLSVLFGYLGLVISPQKKVNAPPIVSTKAETPISSDQLDSEVVEPVDTNKAAKNTSFTPPVMSNLFSKFRPVATRGNLIIVLILALGGYVFYWTQIRPTNIKKNCYSQAFRHNEENFEWAEGKIWTYVAAFPADQNGWIYPEYLPVRSKPSDHFRLADDLVSKGIFDRSIITDTLIANSMNNHRENRHDVYNKCLLSEGL